MPRKFIRPAAITLAVIGAILIVIGLIYLTTKASSLPGFMPGHLPKRVGKKGHTLPTHAHVKLGVVLLIVAVGSFAAAWFVAFRYEPAD